MLVVKVWCLPKQEEAQLNILFESIVKAVVNIEELGIKSEKDMLVLFPTDAMSYGLGTEIYVEVSRLFQRAERTVQVRRRLARDLGLAVHGLYPDARVECLLETSRPEQGFWSSQEIEDARKAAENPLAIPALPLSNRYLNGGYTHEYVEPAVLTEYEVEEILGMWGNNSPHYRFLHRLLVTGKNHPTVATDIIQAMALPREPHLDGYRTAFNTRWSNAGLTVRMIATSPRGAGGRTRLAAVEFQLWRVRKRRTPL